MDEITKIVLYTLFTGLCMLLGGVLAQIERIRPACFENELRHAEPVDSGLVAYSFINSNDLMLATHTITILSRSLMVRAF